MKPPTEHTQALAPLDVIDRSIIILRGHRVMLDSTLAYLYEVETKVLNQAVRRNRDRFPEDFMFQLTKEERDQLRFHPALPENLRSQFVTSSYGGRRYAPLAFTEQGVAMLSSVLRSPRAVHVNIEIMRAFVRLRRMLGSNAELARKLAVIEKRYDAQFKTVFDAIRQLMAPEKTTRRYIGFREKE